MRKKWYLSRALAAVLVVAMLSGCAWIQSAPPEAKGGAVGGAAGAVTGALINGWKGGVIGGVIGVVAGATITHIATKASREAAQNKKPVSYTSDGGTHRVEAYPVASKGRCHTVKEKYYEGGQMVKETEREVCD
ncbi:MAG: hypothetical protein HY910_12365 [Desulfarculus sp.]|nr:hypothetical protein [Desulfarculus sp.]